MSIRMRLYLLLSILTVAFAVNAEDIIERSVDQSAAEITSDSTSIAGNDDAEILSDSINVVNQDDIEITSDSINVVNQDDIEITSDSINVVNQDNAEVPPDSVPASIPVPIPPPPPIKGSFIAFNIGLSIGEVPIFTMWQSTHPTTLQNLGFDADFGSGLALDDNAFLRYSVRQNPDQFNFVIPFGVSVNRIYDDRSFSFSLFLIQSRRQFQAELTIDGNEQDRRIDLFESMSYSSISVEFAYQWAIPQMFFSIDGTQQTFLLVGAGVSPLNFFARNGEINNNAPDDDLRMAAVADSVSAKFSNISANGFGFTWRAGINTLRSYRNGGGLEMGLFYSGSYTPNFYANGASVTQSEIDGIERDENKPLSFITSRIEFKFTFLRSLWGKREKTADE